jgi:outer membrane protein assembly factor BamE (lipoprotein component of BamABCDE complex)
MKQVLTIFSICLFLMIISSCSTTYIAGKNFDETKVSTLMPGKTNESQVLQMFGEPFQKGLINQFRVYIYTYEENEFPADSGFEVYINKRHKSLMIVFDENNVVSYFTHNVPLSPGTMDMMILKEESIKQQKDDDNM